MLRYLVVFIRLLCFEIFLVSKPKYSFTAIASIISYNVKIVKQIVLLYTLVQKFNTYILTEFIFYLYFKTLLRFTFILIARCVF